MDLSPYVKSIRSDRTAKSDPFVKLIENLTRRDLRLRRTGRPLKVVSLKLVFCPRSLHANKLRPPLFAFAQRLESKSKTFALFANFPRAKRNGKLRNGSLFFLSLGKTGLCNGRKGREKERIGWPVTCSHLPPPDSFRPLFFDHCGVAVDHTAVSADIHHSYLGISRNHACSRSDLASFIWFVATKIGQKENIHWRTCGKPMCTRE